MRSDLLAGDYAHGVVQLRCSDVEGLYTNLTHPVVMEAARFLDSDWGDWVVIHQDCVFLYDSSIVDS
jgi:hypothetical protein